MRVVADVKEKPHVTLARATRGELAASNVDNRPVAKDAAGGEAKSLGEITAAIVKRLDRERRGR